MSMENLLLRDSKESENRDSGILYQDINKDDSMITDEVVEDYLEDGFVSEIASINENGSHVTTG